MFQCKKIRMEVILTIFVLSLLQGAAQSASGDFGPPAFKSHRNNFESLNFALDRKPEKENNSENWFVENGKLCRKEKMLVEETEFEEQIHCKVVMEKKCRNNLENNISENDNFENDLETYTEDVCHTMYKKECEIQYRPQMSKVKVKICPGGQVKVMRSLKEDESHEVKMSNLVMDVRPAEVKGRDRSEGEKGACQGGRRSVCVNKYETECNTEYIKHPMKEDHPRCRVHQVEKCNSDNSDCRRVPAMRCKIETRTVMKTKPETKCKRVPRQMCRQEACQKGGKSGRAEDLCYYRMQVVNEILPEEKCNFRPHRMCHQVRRRRRRKRQRFGRLFGRGNRFTRFRREAATENDPPMFTTPRPLSVGGGGGGKSAGKFKKCRHEPVERCEKRKMNPRPVTKEMDKKICRAAATRADVDLMQRLLAAENGGGSGDEDNFML